MFRARLPLAVALAAALALALALGLAATRDASAATQALTATEAPTPLREHAGIVVLSRFDEAAGVFRLALLREGREELVPVAPAPAPFDADIGSDTRGEPQLVYARCDHEQRLEPHGRRHLRGERDGCDLFVFSLTRDTGERPVRNANTSDQNEIAPTLWRGRIAFVRDLRDPPRPVVYTKTLTAPRSKPSTRLPGLPARRGDATVDGSIRELELYGRRLAQATSIAVREGPADGLFEPGSSERFLEEVRLVDLRSGSSEVVGRAGVGISAQAFVGPSFAGGRLGWHLTCFADPCAGRAYRHRISTGELERAPTLGHRSGGRATGFALLDGAEALLAGSFDHSSDGCDEPAPGPDASSPDTRRCPLLRLGPLGFRGTRSPR